MSKNDVTGDNIKSRVNTKEFETNFDKIFRKPVSDHEYNVKCKCLKCINTRDIKNK